MSKPIEIAKEIEEKIYDLPEAKEYLKLKKIIEENEEIQTLQKEIISKQNSGQIEEANALISRLNSNPIVINFNSVKEELAITLRQISDILK